MNQPDMLALVSSNRPLAEIAMDQARAGLAVRRKEEEIAQMIATPRADLARLKEEKERLDLEFRHAISIIDFVNRDEK